MSLKNIYNPLLKYGLQRVTDDSEWVVPADALVIDKLSQNYTADASTPENIKINDITANNIKFMLPSSLTTDKYINIYIDEASTYGLIVNDGTQDYSIPQDTHIECYYSMELDSWSITYELPKPQTLVCSFADYKAIAAQRGTDYWYHIGRLKTTLKNTYPKHVIVFKIFSEQAFSNSGKCVYAEAYYNVYVKNNSNEYGGVFICTTCESKSQDGTEGWFKPEDIISVTTGTQSGGDFASDIWVKLPNNTSVYFAIEVYGGTGTNKWSWANNRWVTSGTVDQTKQDASETQPTGNVHVCEDKASLPTDVLRRETYSENADIKLVVSKTQHVKIQANREGGGSTYMQVDDENIEMEGLDMTFNGKTVPTLDRTFASGDTITALDSALFVASEAISAVTIADTDRTSTFAMSFNTAASGTITVTFPASYKFTITPTFSNSEHWEIAVRGGFVVWQKFGL